MKAVVVAGQREGVRRGRRHHGVRRPGRARHIDATLPSRVRRPGRDPPTGDRGDPRLRARRRHASSRSPATCAVAADTARGSASPRSCSASSPGPAAPSASPGWSGRRGRRSSCGAAARSGPTRRSRSDSSTASCRATRSKTTALGVGGRLRGGRRRGDGAREAGDRRRPRRLARRGARPRGRGVRRGVRHRGRGGPASRSFLEHGPGKAKFSGG